MALGGVDPMQFLATESHFERMVMLAVARAAADQQEKLDRNFAVKVANAVWGAVKK